MSFLPELLSEMQAMTSPFIQIVTDNDQCVLATYEGRELYRTPDWRTDFTRFYVLVWSPGPAGLEISAASRSFQGRLRWLDSFQKGRERSAVEAEVDPPSKDEEAEETVVLPEETEPAPRAPSRLLVSAMVDNLAPPCVSLPSPTREALAA